MSDGWTVPDFRNPVDSGAIRRGSFAGQTPEASSPLGHHLGFVVERRHALGLGLLVEAVRVSWPVTGQPRTTPSQGRPHALEASQPKVQVVFQDVANPFVVVGVGPWSSTPWIARSGLPAYNEGSGGVRSFPGAS